MRAGSAGLNSPILRASPDIAMKVEDEDIHLNLLYPVMTRPSVACEPTSSHQPFGDANESPVPIPMHLDTAGSEFNLPIVSSNSQLPTRIHSEEPSGTRGFTYSHYTEPRQSSQEPITPTQRRFDIRSRRKKVSNWQIEPSLIAISEVSSIAVVLCHILTFVKGR